MVPRPTCQLILRPSNLLFSYSCCLSLGWHSRVTGAWSYKCLKRSPRWTKPTIKLSWERTWSLPCSLRRPNLDRLKLLKSKVRHNLHLPTASHLPDLAKHSEKRQAFVALQLQNALGGARIHLTDRVHDRSRPTYHPRQREIFHQRAVGINCWVHSWANHEPQT